MFSVIAITFNVKAKNWDGLFDWSQYYNAKISPDGKHFAVATLNEGKTILVFLED